MAEKKKKKKGLGKKAWIALAAALPLLFLGGKKLFGGKPSGCSSGGCRTGRQGRSGISPCGVRGCPVSDKVIAGKPVPAAEAKPEPVEQPQDSVPSGEPQKQSNEAVVGSLIGAKGMMPQPEATEKVEQPPAPLAEDAAVRAAQQATPPPEAMFGLMDNVTSPDPESPPVAEPIDEGGTLVAQEDDDINDLLNGMNINFGGY